MKWFKHDSDARHDAKLARLRMKYGLEGYGLYFFLLECIAGNVESHNLTFELEEDAELIAAMTNIHVDRINDMVGDMVKFGLFDRDVDNKIYCLRMATRTDAYTEKLVRKMNNVRTLSVQNTDSVSTKSALIDKKRTDKTKSSGRFTPPTVKAVAEYCSERKNNVDCQKFIDYYSAQGWVLANGQKMKDWKAAVRNWESRQTKSSGHNPLAGAI